MADIPIIFSAPMVQALLAGRKTMTRRLLKKQPARRETIPADATWAPDGGFKKDRRAGHTWSLHSPYLSGSRLLHAAAKVPYAVGDRLWVREAWNVFALSQDGDCSWPVKEIPKRHPREDDDAVRCIHVVDYATAGLPGAGAGKGPWRSPIHMPRWASRLTLIVTAARVERLQEISEADAMAEGMAATYPRARFCGLWDHLHGPGAWDANPEVVVIRFTVAQRNIDAPQPTESP